MPGGIDPGLKLLLARQPMRLRAAGADTVFAVAEDESADRAVVSLLVEFEGDGLDEAMQVGFRPRTVIGSIASGDIDLDSVEALGALAGVRRAEAARVLHSELDRAVPEVQGDAVHAGPPGQRGTGVVVGLIDSGIDPTHPSFRRTNGTTRLLALWDQGLEPDDSEASPAGFGYGVEYQTEAIDAALALADPSDSVRHQDRGDFHGTHVAGIAAGNGAGLGASPSFSYIGMAPEADIVLVANTRGRASGEWGLGDSADTLDAVRYIFELAERLGRPAVINLSQGDNIGPHDGTSPLERAIDGFLGGPGRAVVKSAGNEGNKGHHASGRATTDAPTALRLHVPSEPFPITVDLWYAGDDSFDVQVIPPRGAPSALVSPGDGIDAPLDNGNAVFVDSDQTDPDNGAKRIFLTIAPGTRGSIAAGAWEIRLVATTVVDGRWDAWIQRGTNSKFLPPLVNPARSITIPGTSQEIITVGAYVTRGAGPGSISSFSSLGPTRDDRSAPTIAAPGQALTSAAPVSTGALYVEKSGTSMAAPIVTGTIALMLQANPTLTQDQIRACLASTARTDAFTSPTVPNNAWGAGKLDALAAVECARAAGGGAPADGEAELGLADASATEFWYDDVGYSAS